MVEVIEVVGLRLRRVIGVGASARRAGNAMGFDPTVGADPAAGAEATRVRAAGRAGAR
jgi:hypothetical protein